MKVAVIVFATIASAYCGSRVQRQHGWGSSTPGWTTTTPPPPPTTTTGWPSTTTPGWPGSKVGWSSTTPGWPSTTTTTGWTTTTPPPPPTTTGWPSTTTPGWSTPGWAGAKVGGWSSSTPGWSTPAPTTTTPGWTTPPPTTTGWPTTTTTTQGWSTPGWAGSRAGWNTPSTTPGWGTPSTAGWGAASLTNIDVAAAIAAAGSGWANENHAENVQAIGAGGWGPNAEIAISAGGESITAQDGSILQVTSQDSQSAASLNNASVGQVAEANEGEAVQALGVDIVNQQSGWASAVGEGASGADAVSSLNVQGIQSQLGMAKP